MNSVFTLLSILMALSFNTRSIMTAASSITKKACLGAGCYWGTEKFLKSDFPKMFPDSGRVTSGKVGFMGPSTAKPNPSYREVCGGQTGHVEVYDFEFEGDEKTYENLIRHFYMFHDSTTLNRQGNDRGTQYASVIFTYDEVQKQIAQKVTAEFQERLTQGKVGNSYEGKKVATDIRDATIFYAAEDYHQEYLDNNPGGYCNHGYRFKSWD